jgi:hypothetical protein
MIKVKKGFTNDLLRVGARNDNKIPENVCGVEKHYCLATLAIFIPSVHDHDIEYLSVKYTTLS